MIPTYVNLQETGPPRGGGTTGAFCPEPHSANGPQKSIYSNRTVNTLLKQSPHIFPWAPQALSAALTRKYVCLHAIAYSKVSAFKTHDT